MPIVVALASIAGLFGVAIAMPFLVSRPGLATKVAYVASAALCLPLLGVGLFGLLGGNASHGAGVRAKFIPATAADTLPTVRLAGANVAPATCDVAVNVPLQPGATWNE